jgi:hypothetical protein
MSKNKLTPWFPGDVKPARPGVYETDAETDSYLCYQLWTGNHWGWCSANSGFVLPYESRYQSPRWRGLAKEPK